MFTSTRIGRALTLSAIVTLATTGCAPSAAQQQATATAIAATVIAQITASAPTQTPTPAATPTETPAPTDTPEPTETPEPTSTPGPSSTPKPTSTPRPTATPIPGTFSNPIAIGQAGTTRSDFYKSDMTITVLEVKRGKDALATARRLQYFFTAPVEKQEYLLVKIKIQWLTGSSTKKIITFTYGDFALRYDNNGESLLPSQIDRLAEGYVPLEKEGWLQFLIREGSQPVLYVQPELVVAQKLGLDTDTGLYYSLEP